MNKHLLYILSLMLLSAPAYADVNVATDATKIDFGKSVLLASTGTVGVDSGSRPLWLRAMRATTGTIPTAGTITFSSDMTDGYEMLIIQPTATSSTEFPITSGSSCALSVTNLSFSANAVTLTTGNKIGSINVGGSVKIDGFCKADYDYTGTISVPYKIMDSTQNELKTGVVALPIEFHSEYKTDITKDTDMNFGQVIINGAAGTVVMNTEGVITTFTGGVVKVNGPTTAGQISIFGAENLPITNVTYDELIYLRNGEHSVTVNNFTLSPGRTFTLNESKNGQGYKMLKIGGTLNIGENQPVGEYSGTLNVRISY